MVTASPALYSPSEKSPGRALRTEHHWLLEPAVHVQDEVNGAGRVVVHADASRAVRGEEQNCVVGTSLPRAEVDRRGRGDTQVQRVDAEVSRSGGRGHGDVRGHGHGS